MKSGLDRSGRDVSTGSNVSSCQQTTLPPGRSPISAIRQCGSFAVAVALLVLLPSGSASACPMCAETAASDPLLPQAYMTSILFMLAVPFAMFGLFGLWIGRSIRRQDAARWASYVAQRDQAASSDAALSGANRLSSELDPAIGSYSITTDISPGLALPATHPRETSPSVAKLAAAPLVGPLSQPRPESDLAPETVQKNELSRPAVPSRGADLIVVGCGDPRGLCFDLAAPSTHVVAG